MAVSQAPASTGQVRLLWLIKANEFLLETLKLARPSEDNRQWVAMLRRENAELKARSKLYEPLQLGLKYRPDQPRVPAGNPDGGQWTDDGGGTLGNGSGSTVLASGHGRFGGAVATTERPETDLRSPEGTAAELVQFDDDPKQYSIDLDEEEAPRGIGHTIRRHVAQSDEALKARMRADYREWETPKGTAREFAEAYGTFDTQANANDMVNRVLQGHEDIVDAVARGETADATLEMRFGRPTGREAYRPRGDSYPYVRTTFAVRVIIVHDKRSKRGYRVKTALPCNKEPERKP